MLEGVRCNCGRLPGDADLATIEEDVFVPAKALERTTLLAGQRTVERTVILVHGIMTRAEWQTAVVPILEGASTKVIPLSYGYLDTFRFWFPFGTRRKAIDVLEWKIRQAIGSATGEVVIIAHSFGTYATIELMQDKPDLRVDRVLLCGAILPYDFRWDQILARGNAPSAIVNDCGRRDVWPVLAKSCSWGYGDAGRFGFGTAGITDRFHDCGHSDFFDETFVRRYWRSWVEDEQLVMPPVQPGAKAPAWLNLVGLLPLQWLLLVGLVVVIWLIVR